VYPTREAAYARFVTLPPQEVILPYVRENVVAQSLREVLGGWTWKFDPALFGNAKTIRALLEQVTCPAIYLRCEHGIVSLATTRQIAESCAVDMPIVELPASGHHPMLDQPLPLVAAIRAAIARW
jgi:pimeloyl-ACP methyl ester carboxylesterase